MAQEQPRTQSAHLPYNYYGAVTNIKCSLIMSIPSVNTQWHGFLVLASQSQCKMSNAPSAMNLAVDEEKTKPSHWLGLVHCSLQCFYTVGWVTGRTYDRQKTSVSLI